MPCPAMTDGVVVGMDQDAAALGHHLRGDGLAVLGRAVIGDDRRAAPFRPRELCGGRIGRHDDGRRHAEETGGLGDALGVVAGGDGDDALRPDLRVEAGQRIVGAAELERAGALQALGLEEDARAGDGVEIRAGEERGPHGVAGETRGGGAEIGNAGKRLAHDQGAYQRAAAFATLSADGPVSSALAVTILSRNWRAEASQLRASAKARHLSRGIESAASAAMPEVLVEDADAGAADHVGRARHRVGGDRDAGGERLEEHDAEGVGPAREDEDVGAGIGLGQRLAGPHAEEVGLRVRRLERRQRRPVADHHLAAGQVEGEEGADVLLDRDPADEEEDGARQVERATSRGRKSSLSTPRVQGTRCSKPRAASSRRSDSVATMVARPALWKRRRSA